MPARVTTTAPLANRTSGRSQPGGSPGSKPIAIVARAAAKPVPMSAPQAVSHAGPDRTVARGGSTSMDTALHITISADTGASTQTLGW